MPNKRAPREDVIISDGHYEIKAIELSHCCNMNELFDGWNMWIKNH